MNPQVPTGCRRRRVRLLLSGPLLASIMTLTGCLSPPRWSDSPASPLLAWERVSQPRAVVVLVHGMNNTPEAMGGFRDLLAAQGCTVASVRLTGHDPASNRRHGATREQWIEDVDRAIAGAREAQPNVPVVGVGYSLGAALLTAWVDQGNDLDGMILIAPGICIQPAVNIMRPLKSLAGVGLSLPSLTPRAYRAFRLTSLDTYRALFDVVDALENLERASHVARTPTLILADRNDELVDIEALVAWIERHSLHGWVLRDLRTLSWHHVMFDRETMGDGAWQAAGHHIAEFLGRLPVSGVRSTDRPGTH